MQSRLLLRRVAFTIDESRRKIGIIGAICWRLRTQGKLSLRSIDRKEVFLKERSDESLKHCQHHASTKGGKEI